MTKNLVDTKKEKRKKNPNFIRQDANKKKRLSKKWRKPRGEHSKQRNRIRNQPLVGPGYGTPKELRGKHFSGLDIIYLASIVQVEQINPKTQGVIVSGKIGLRKRIPILKELVKKKITILNIPNPEEFINIKEEELKKTKKQTKKTDEKKKTEKKEKLKEEKSIEDKLSDEEKKKIEKKEIDKLLTKKR